MKIDEEYIITTTFHPLDKRGKRTNTVGLKTFQLFWASFYPREWKDDRKLKLKRKQSDQDSAAIHEPRIMERVGLQSNNVSLVHNTQTNTHSGVHEPTEKQQVSRTERETEWQT